MSTGSKIKELREKRGMTQEELAGLLGLKKAAVNKYETGRVVNLKRSTILKLCQVFDVMPQDLMDLRNASDESSFDSAAAPHSQTTDLSPSLIELIDRINELSKAEQNQLKEFLDMTLNKEHTSKK